MRRHAQGACRRRAASVRRGKTDRILRLINNSFAGFRKSVGRANTKAERGAGAIIIDYTVFIKSQTLLGQLKYTG